MRPPVISVPHGCFTYETGTSVWLAEDGRVIATRDVRVESSDAWQVTRTVTDRDVEPTCVVPDMGWADAFVPGVSELFW